jgi:hypothetical protein
MVFTPNGRVNMIFFYANHCKDVFLTKVGIYLGRVEEEKKGGSF